MKSSPRLRKEEKVTKDSAKVDEVSADAEEKKIVVKKWKGKDWFNVLAPPNFAEVYLAQTPTTDPKNLKGRNIEVSVSDITGDSHKDHMKMKFLIERVEDKNAHTRFNGFEVVRQHVMRMVRKRNRKVQMIFDATTKDGWVLKVTALSVLNGKAAANVMGKARNLMVKQVNELASSCSLSEFLRKIISTQMQMQIKKSVSKLYPVRFFEIEKMKVLKPGESKAARTNAPREEKKPAPGEDREKKSAGKKENE